MDCQQAWAEIRHFWRPFIFKYQEDQRLRTYFRRVALEIPVPPKGWQEAAKPCKWKKILEEKK